MYDYNHNETNVESCHSPTTEPKISKDLLR